jgi:hypothetical protein
MPAISFAGSASGSARPHDAPRHDAPRHDAPRHDAPRHDAPRHPPPRHPPLRRAAPLDAEAVALVRHTWAFVRADAPLFQAQYVAALHAREPALALLLGDDPDGAAGRLVHALDVAVRDLERLHVAAGRVAGAAALGAAGDALLDALAACLGTARFDAAARAAWATTWASVAALLRAKGARRAAA